MSCLSHITLSLAIPLPFPQLVACPQHPKPGHGSPNFCGHPLIFLLLSVVKIPGLRRSLVAEQSIGRNWPHFEWGFSACSHPFLTKWISQLQLPRWWLSRDMFGSAGRCWHPLHVWEECAREIDSLLCRLQRYIVSPHVVTNQNKSYPRPPTSSFVPSRNSVPQARPLQ